MTLCRAFGPVYNEKISKDMNPLKRDWAAILARKAYLTLQAAALESN